MILYYKKLYAYTLSELRSYIGLGEVYANDDTNTFAQILTALGIDISIPTGSLIADLFQKVMAKYNDEFYHVGEAITDDNKDAINRKWIVKFITLYNESKDYYEKLINIYTSQESKLMDLIENENVNKVMFNDTPQTVSGVFEGEEYATHFTKSENTIKTPAMTPIMRIKEIQDSYKQVWRDWVNEFERIVIENDTEVF